MLKRSITTIAGSLLVVGMLNSCAPTQALKQENRTVPDTYQGSSDSTNSVEISWSEFFNDPNLKALVDTALVRNQELNIFLQEVLESSTEIKARKGEYLPFVSIGAGGGIDKVGRYTREGVVESNHEIMEGREFPEPLGDVTFGLSASWELDVWKKLRNSKKSAVMNYLSTVEGKNFLVTQIVAEIANSYFELLALDNQLAILKQNIQIQKNALEVVKMQKEAAKVTELAVKRFEAEVAKNQSLIYELNQEIVETENRINFMLGRYPQPIVRSSAAFPDLMPKLIEEGVPSQLLANRPDIRQAELALEASKLDIKVAKAEFYPAFRIVGGIGYQAFNPRYLVTTPESLIFNLAGDLVAPLVNRNAIKANLQAANARQVAAVYDYEKSILNGYIEVANQLSKIDNLQESFALKSKQVEALTQSITISNNLFSSARADYMEVLLTQREALESRMELIETKKQQMNAMVDMYQALGGGWN